MKKFTFILLAAVLLVFSACSRDPVPDSSEVSPRETLAGEYSVEVEYSYVEKLDSIEDVARYATNIITATLVSVEDFNGYVSVYRFNVKEDYTNNTPDEVYMYDAYNSSYVIGHTYYLFLCSGESALYPHTIYTTVVKDLIIDTDKTTTTTSLGGNDFIAATNEVSESIENSITLDIVGAKVDAALSVSDSLDKEFLSDSADIIAEVRVSSEVNANIYASTYAVEVISLLKGPSDAVPSSLNLPPDLDPGKTYFVFLKETPDGGTYSLFSRAYPVMDTASVSVEEFLVG